MTYWQVGRAINENILANDRADYGKQILASLSQQLTDRFGRGFAESGLNRMVAFARIYPDERIPATLSQELSWSHFHLLIPLKSDEAREFYARKAVEQHLSVREMRKVIERKAFERQEIADSRITIGSALPLDAFKDPFLLDFLGMKENYQESDLENAIIHELQSFLMEVGNGWTFVERQKRITMDGDDYYIDLLFYSRPMKRLIAVEL